ncbi:MAG: DUF4242 domain-containing protein [Pseudomonadales bacterium]
MTHVFVERDFEEAILPEQVQAMVADNGSCLDMWKVTWISSLLSKDGRKMFCHFEGSDTDSVKTAFRQTGGIAKSIWPGTLHVATESLQPNVVVERRFNQSTAIEAVQAIEDANIECLNSRNVVFVKTYFSLDKTQMICLYHAPDTESVRQAQQQAGMPVTSIWPCTQIAP